MRELIDLVEVLRLEEEVADLPRPHGDKPADERRDAGVHGEQHVGRQEAQRAQEMQRLIDPTVVVETMIVPALLFELIEKAQGPLVRNTGITVHSSLPHAAETLRASW